MRKIFAAMIAVLIATGWLTACTDTTQPEDVYGFTTVNITDPAAGTVVTWNVEGTLVTQASDGPEGATESSYQLADRAAFVRALDNALNKPDRALDCEGSEMTVQTQVEADTHAAHLRHCGSEQKLFEALRNAVSQAG